MPLTFAQKSSVRRHLDYPVAGLIRNSPAGGSLASAFVGYRFLQAYGRLEWKLNNLNPDEEARLVGLAYGAVALIGPQPNAGDQISVQISGGGLGAAQTISATMPAVPVGTDGLPQFILALAANAAANTALQAAQFLALAPFGTGPFNQNQLPLAECAFTCPASFAISNPTGTGVLVPQITAAGSMLPPSATVDGTNTVNGYLAILDALETAYANASQNLDTSAAGPWKARQQETAQRLQLYRNWQVRLSKFLEIPLYEGAGTPARSDYTGSARFM